MVIGDYIVCLCACGHRDNDYREREKVDTEKTDTDRYNGKEQD